MTTEFNPQNIAHEVVTSIYQRMLANGFSETDAQKYANYLFQWAETAGQLLLQDQGIQIPDSQQTLPIDEAMASQAIGLFTEGTFHSIMKGRELGIPDNLLLEGNPAENREAGLVQAVAQYVFEHAKQLVVATYGQEHTPDLQFSREQQVEMVNQTAENAFHHFLKEHEDTHGPVNPSPQALEELSQHHELPSDESYSESEDEAMSQAPSQQQPASAPAKGANPHDKYAAVALLLETLNPRHKQSILKQFGAEEKNIIGYYSNPENIQNELNLLYVHQHLQRFRQALMKAPAKVKNRVEKQLGELTQNVPREKLFASVRHERPIVQKYLESYFLEEEDDEFILYNPDPQREEIMAARNLPAKIEEAIYTYLAKQVG